MIPIGFVAARDLTQQALREFRAAVSRLSGQWMTMTNAFPWGPVMSACLCAASAVAQPAPTPIDDEEFPPSEVVTGKQTSKEQCEATRDAVWVEHAEGTECIRYFPSSDAKGAKVVAMFFHGDNLDGRMVIGYGENRASSLRKLAEGLARANRVPYVIVARPGVYGSSGRHAERRKLREYLSVNAAVDAIKVRLGLERVHLGGQSGGAATVGALLTLGRDDVVCAVASSGPFDALGRAREMRSQTRAGWNGCDVTGVCDIYNVTDHVPGVKPSDFRRIFIIGDPQDSNTRFVFQAAFAEKLKAAGHDVTLAEAHALGAAHHSLTHMANRTLGWCHAGFDAGRIAELIRTDTPALANDKRSTAP
jgi:pimeloyl-ACP methyl ester carboxylesterase